MFVVHMVMSLSGTILSCCIAFLATAALRHEVALVVGSTAGVHSDVTFLAPTDVLAGCFLVDIHGKVQ